MPPPNIDPNALVNIPCPKCGQKAPHTVSELETAPRLICESCGAPFAVNARKLMEKIKAAQTQAEYEQRRRGV